ncbi:hypothetical protein Tco_0366727 [Tanacetum coccineum]
MVAWWQQGFLMAVVVEWWSQRGVEVVGGTWCNDDEGEVDGGDEVGCGVVMMVWWVSAAGWPKSGWRWPEMIGGEEMYVWRSVVSSVSSPNELKSLVILPNAFQM